MTSPSNNPTLATAPSTDPADFVALPEEWGTTPERLMTQMIDAAAWHLLDVSCDLADREPGAEAYERAQADSVRFLSALVTAAARAGRRATLDPGAYVNRLHSEDERLDQWQNRALLAAVDRVLPTSKEEATR